MMNQFDTKTSLQSTLRWVGSIFCLLMVVFSAHAQRAERTAYTLQGVVTEPSGPVIGATVIVAGTNFGAATDVDGNYSFTANLSPGTYQLVFSSLGFTNANQSITLGTEAVVKTDATLGEDAIQLDEAVAIGSTLKSSRRQLGNNITTVTAENLQNTGTGNLISALQGKVAGAQITQNSGDPAGGISVRLRGLKSIQGNSDPLYVIDGVIVSNSTVGVTKTAEANSGVGSTVAGTNRMADINPADIESMSILSGAAAAAIYGSRASNGVVLITTKRGKAGAPEVSFSTSFNINELRKKVPISTYGKQFGFAGLRLHPIGAVTAAVATANNATITPITRDGAVTNLATNLVDVTRYDYQDLIFQKGMGTDNNLSVSGGTDKTRYYGSASYMQNEGIIVGSDFKRYGMRLNLDQTLASWAKVSLGVNYVNSFSNEKPDGNVFYSPINGINITNNIYDAASRDGNGNLKAVEPTRINPLSATETFKITQEVNRAISNVRFDFFPVDGLTINFIGGVDAIAQVGKTFIPPYPYDGVNTAYYANGYAATVNNITTLFNNDLNITYEKQFGRIKSTTSAGYNYQFTKGDYTRASGENIVPSIQSVSGASVISAGYGLERYSVAGMFAQETFGIDNVLFLTVAGRVDGSSKFTPEKNNQFYPKVSGSLVVSELGFWKNNAGLNKAINALKLRGSWGDAGGLTALGSYDRFWRFNPTPFLGKSAVLPGSQLANPLVVPERTRELEGGIDASFLNNRANVGITVYQQKVFDLVVNRVLASTSGGKSIINNVGEMENKGVEVLLGLTPIKTKDFNWDINVSYSANQNKVTKLGSPFVAISTASGTPSFLIQGYPASVFYGTYYAADANGKQLNTVQGLPQSERGTIKLYNAGDPIPAGGYVVANQLLTPVRNADGQPPAAGTVQLRKVIGDPNPKWLGSFSTGISYKNIRLSGLLDAVQGVDVFNADRRTRQGVGIGDVAEKELKGELPRGYIFSIYPIEEWRIDNGSFVKLREISLAYSLPKIKGFSSLTLALVGRNLMSWDNYQGFDPETNAGGNSDLLRGVDFGNVPIPRTYQVALSAKF
jgi:TonB-linked SusC/RagA family outer membrane protein